MGTATCSIHCHAVCQLGTLNCDTESQAVREAGGKGFLKPHTAAHGPHSTSSLVLAVLRPINPHRATECILIVRPGRTTQAVKPHQAEKQATKTQMKKMAFFFQKASVSSLTEGGPVCPSVAEDEFHFLFIRPSYHSLAMSLASPFYVRSYPSVCRIRVLNRHSNHHVTNVARHTA